MSQTMVQIRVDKELKDQVANIYDAIGIDIPTAIRMFFKRSISVGGLPFDCRMNALANCPEKMAVKKSLAERIAEKRQMAGESFSRSMDEGRAAFAMVREEAAKREYELTLDDINDEIAKSRKERKTGSK